MATKESIGGGMMTATDNFNIDAIPTLRIYMTRGERRIADELRKEFGGFKRVIIDMDGEEHEFGADILIRLLEGYEDSRDTPRCSELLGTHEQAIAATLGPVTCRQEERGWGTEGDHARVFLTCGHDCMVETVADLPNFCPVCGAKVVDA